ncbi:MAG: bifunctional [glutamate--ammonia ligase]-adenylyl-L-tyrosine phosphorylase/[glutamate--ammonia-ligase] adenylyltransferase [Candidatus Desulfatibia sp.]|uniref:bifunctional [glutamate--ammonia ligase]-adenylyl-L-tyrosine phosphorylase/[glutamate--ammonia-ligase] adenylyltransferase n=1 Tax=Candidatus Desulfatibia sp. TaxID=3101189 RepID=UPI002F30EDC3
MKRANKPSQDLTKEFKRKWDAFCHAASDAGITPIDDPAIIAAAKRALPFSDFISKSCIRDPEMFEDLMSSGNLQRRFMSGEYDTMLESFLLEAQDDEQLSILFRRFRRREMVRIAWRDLAGWADLSETMADLSNLADACLDQAAFLLYEWQCSEYGMPVDHDGLQQNLVVLGMGKLGGRELNFSSDVDLIFAYPEIGETRGATTSISNEEFFVRLCRRLIKVIGATTTEGIVFRVDTDLRPYGKSGPLVMSFDAMEAYYQEQGREWERYAWIKARVAAGDKAAGALLMERLKPFVYRRYLDFGAFESLRHMKQSIAFEVKRKKMANNIKLGPGGIREIEFFGQVLQLIRGGVSPALQEGSIQKALKALTFESIIPQNVCGELTEAYVFLRNIENRLQAFADRQTHKLPSDPVAKTRLAASMGFADPGSFFRCLAKHRENVHNHFVSLLEAKDSEYSGEQVERMENGLEAVWQSLIEEDHGRNVLIEAGFENPAAVMRLLDYLRNDQATRSLSSAGRNRLDKLMPLMLKKIGLSEQPLPVLNRIIDLVKTIQRRTNYLALLLENPTTIDHLVKLTNASPWIVSFLARHPVLLDELLDPRTLYAPPEKSDLVKEVRKKLDRISGRDLEYQIQELCIFKQINTLRVAAADITGALTLMRTSDHLTEIAETILNEVIELAWSHLVEKHGRPLCRLCENGIGRGFAVIAYGKLGGIELGYSSDLDLVFLHAGAEGHTQGGIRPIDNSQFFARLGQRVVHILTAHTPAGMLYEPDMRLRPSGSQGLLVSNIEGFKDYQMNKAWTWEHQALIKARAVSGDIKMAGRFDQIRKEVLGRPRIKTDLQKEVTDMRKQMRRELLNPEPGFFDLKQDSGGIVDIEFLVQYLVLLKSCEYAELLQWTDNIRILETLIETGILEKHTANFLKEAYLTYRAAVHKLNLQEKPARIPESKFRSLRENVEKIWKDIMDSG